MRVHRRGILIASCLGILSLIVAQLGLSAPASAAVVTYPGYNGRLSYEDKTPTLTQLNLTTIDDQQASLLKSNTGMTAEPQVSLDGTKITYIKCTNVLNAVTGCHVYIADTDGTDEVQVTPASGAMQRPQFSPDGTKIVFESQVSGAYRIFVIDVDGTDMTNLTVGAAGSDFMPLFSPDGTKIVFYSTRDGSTNREIYVMNANGSEVTRLTNSIRDDYRPRWSPNGAKIVFYSSRIAANNYEIYSMDANGANQTRLTTATGHDENPEWNHDGTKIVFQSMRDGNSEIYTMNANGTSPTRLTNNSDTDRTPQYSYDGTKITYGACGDTINDGNFSCDIRVMDSGGSNNQNITNSLMADDSAPRFLPDGSAVIYVSYTQYPLDDIFTMDSVSGESTPLVSSFYSESEPKWSPDGAKVVFQRKIGATNEIYVINADGTGEVRLTNNAIEEIEPEWSPDSQRVVFKRGSHPNHAIVTINADGTDEAVLTDSATQKHDPQWSPDGSKILYVAYSPARIVVIDAADGANPQTLASGRPDGTNDPSWSPDGKYIVYDYMEASSSNWQVEVVEVESGVTTQLTSGPEYDHFCSADGYSWSPDSKYIAACAMDEDWITSRVAIIERATGQTEYVDLQASDVVYIDNLWWSPDGKKIVIAGSDLDDVRHDFIFDIEAGTVSILDGIGVAYYGSWQRIPNSPPVAANDTATTSFSAPKLINVLANDIDEEAFSGAYLSIDQSPIHGTASIESGQVKYTPDAGYFGSDSLVYQICDSFVLDQLCATANVAITVQAFVLPMLIPQPSTEVPMKVAVRSAPIADETEEEPEDTQDAPGQIALKVTRLNGKTFMKNPDGSYTSLTARPTFSGTAMPGATIKISLGSITLTAIADAEGDWSIAPDDDLAQGDYTVRVTSILNGVTTELQSFVLGVETEEATVDDNTGVKYDLIWWALAGMLVLGLLIFVITRWSQKNNNRA